MSTYYKVVKRYYDKGIYDNDDVAVFVRAANAAYPLLPFSSPNESARASVR